MKFRLQWFCIPVASQKMKSKLLWRKSRQVETLISLGSLVLGSTLFILSLTMLKSLANIMKISSMFGNQRLMGHLQFLRIHGMNHLAVDLLCLVYNFRLLILYIFGFMTLKYLAIH